MKKDKLILLVCWHSWQMGYLAWSNRILSIEI